MLLLINITLNVSLIINIVSILYNLQIRYNIGDSISTAVALTSNFDF